jgi:SHS2 domain-containing protein
VPYEFFDHTGDIGVRLRAASLEDLFAAAAEALADTLSDPASIRPLVPDTVTLDAPDLDLLLVDWLSELLYRFDAHAMLTARTVVAIRSGKDYWHLEATIEGERLDPDRHPVKVLLKAITHHGLAVVRSASGWEASVVFDV